MMQLGAEFPPTPQALSQEGWEIFRALRPRIAKFRMGCSPLSDVLSALDVMYQHTGQPVCVFRPQTEVPQDAAEVYFDFYKTHEAIRNTGALICLEVMNEPNEVRTRLGLGDTPATQIAEYRRRLQRLLGLRSLFPGVPLVAPGLMPGGDMRDWAAPERAQYDFDGVHIYGIGANGLMLPNGFQAEPMVTEINANEAITDPPRRQAATLEMLDAAWGYGVRRFCFFILPWADMGQWGVFGLTIEQARAYQHWAQEKDGGGTVADGGMARLAELKTQFPAKWEAWANAGGTVAQNFELYLIATGDLPKTWDAYDLARNKLISAIEEEREIMGALRPK